MSEKLIAKNPTICTKSLFSPPNLKHLPPPLFTISFKFAWYHATEMTATRDAHV